jgi:hypothetical protein
VIVPEVASENETSHDTGGSTQGFGVKVPIPLKDHVIVPVGE